MSTTHINRLRCSITNTPGLAGNVVVGAATSAARRTFTATEDGKSFEPTFEDGNAWEVRTGCVYTHATSTLTRGTLVDSSTGSAIALTSAAVVTLGATAKQMTDLEQFRPLTSQHVAAMKAGALYSLLNSSGARIGAVGNSLLAFATSFIHCAVGAMDGRATMEYKAAVGGVTSAGMSGQAATLPASCNVVVMMEGTNDANTNVSTATHIANLKAIAAEIMARGFVPVVIASPTRETTVSTIIGYWLPERLWCEAVGIAYVDPWSRYIDTEGSWVAGCTTDGDHPNPATMLQVGLDMAGLLLAGKTGYLLPRSNTLQEGLFSNALLLLDGDANGRPDGWSRLTVTGENFSLAAATYPARGNKCTVVISQTVTAEIFRSLGSSGWSPGHTLRITGMISLASMSNCNFRVYCRPIGGVAFDIIPFIRQANCGDTYFSGEIVMPANTTDLQVWFEASSISGAAFTCTLGFSGVNVYNITANTL